MCGRRFDTLCRVGLLVAALALIGQTAAVGQPAQTGAPAAGARGRDPSKDVSAYTLSPTRHEKAVAYSRAKYRLHFAAFAYGALALFGLLALRVAPKFRDWAEKASPRRFVQALVFVPLLTLTQRVLDLPVGLYRHTLLLRYEQSVQGWASWFWDWAKGGLVGLVVATPLVWILYGVIRRSPRRWWFYFWLAAVPILVFLLFLAPVVIQPLFFGFESLAAKHPELVSQIERVTARGGLRIPPDRMFEMKASDKLKSVNASVTGFGASKRVIVWDTTLQRMTVPQTLFVFGHEMGHYVLRHIVKGIVFFALLLLALLYAGSRAMKWALARWGEKWRIRGMEDWASLPVLLLFFALFGELAQPIGNTYSRWREHEADIYGLEVIHGVVPDSSRAAAQAFQVLGEINLADPDPSPFIKLWLYSHPPLAERLAFARNYNPWSKGPRPRGFGGPHGPPPRFLGHPPNRVSFENRDEAQPRQHGGMRKILPWTFLLAAACAGGSLPRSSEGSRQVFGAAPRLGNPISLEKALSASHVGKAVSVKARVAEVCQKKGCWMVLTDGSRTVRTTFKDYGFFVPKDLSGRTVVAEGTLSREVVSQEDARHYAEESGRSPEEVAAIRGDNAQYTFVAESVTVGVR